MEKSGPHSDREGGRDEQHAPASEPSGAGERPPADERAAAGATETTDKPGSDDAGGAPQAAPTSGAPATAESGATTETRPETAAAGTGLGGGPVANPRRAGADTRVAGAPAAEAAAPGAERAESAERMVHPAETQRFQERWHGIQSAFVDDPRDAVRQADHLTGELLEVLAEAVATRRRSLEERWRTGEEEPADTERLRIVLHGYREFVLRILAV